MIVKSDAIVAKPSKNSKKRAWQNVKIKGNVVSDENVGLEGLIGLEVLEKYDKNLVATERKVKFSKFQDIKNL